jgi:hypothetical protein
MSCKNGAFISGKTLEEIKEMRQDQKKGFDVVRLL